MLRAMGAGALVWLGALGALAQPAFQNPIGGMAYGDANRVVSKIVPRQGVVVLEATGGERPSVQVSQRALDGTVTTLGGTVNALVEPYWAWSPTFELEPGEYDVAVATMYGTGASTVTVVEDVTLEPPELTSDPEAIWSPVEGRAFYCERWAASSLIVQSSFLASYGGQVMVEPNLSTEAPRAQLDQYLYRVSTLNGELARYVPFDETGEPLGPYGTEAEEYCFEIELLDARTGEPRELEALAQVCVPHGELPSLTPSKLEAPEGALDRFDCEAPPDEFREPWCEVNAECDRIPSARRSEQGCALYGYVCEGEGLPGAGAEEMGGSGGGGHCSIEAARPSGRGAGAALLALLVLVLVRAGVSCNRSRRRSCLRPRSSPRDRR